MEEAGGLHFEGGELVGSCDEWMILVLVWFLGLELCCVVVLHFWNSRDLLYGSVWRAVWCCVLHRGIVVWDCMGLYGIRPRTGYDIPCLMNILCWNPYDDIHPNYEFQLPMFLLEVSQSTSSVPSIVSRGVSYYSFPLAHLFTNQSNRLTPSELN